MLSFDYTEHLSFRLIGKTGIILNLHSTLLLGDITVDVLTSDSQNVLDFVSEGFSKTPPEAFWNFASFSFSFCFCHARYLCGLSNKS